MSKPTAQEVKILPQFRQRLANLNLNEERNTDHYLLRWLRARELHMDLAEDMLRKSLKWRKENDIDSLLAWSPTEFLKRGYPMEVVGVDYDKCPVIALPFGRWDLKKLVQDGYRDDLIKYFHYIFESVTDKAVGNYGRDGTAVTQFVVVLDSDQLSMKTLMSFGVVDAILEIVKSFEANYPETLKAAYVVNATKVFSFLFSLMKPLLSQRTFGKIQIWDTNESKWKPILADAVPRNQLPAILGGPKLTQLDERLGLDELDLDEDNKGQPGRSRVTVGAGKTSPIEVKVPLEGSILSWKFKTEENDISYSVTFGDKTLIKNQRVDCHSKPVDGSIICPSTGVYTVTFDNSFSRFRSKLVKYKITVESPKTGNRNDG